MNVNSEDKTKQLLSFEFSKWGHGPLTLMPPITVKNLTDRRIALSYKILGYDGQQRRVSEADDSVVIEAGESVLRQPVLTPDTFNFQTGKSFRLLADIQH